MLIALAAGLAVVVGIIAAVTLTGRGGPGSGSAGDTVKAYVEALGRGDAEAALSFSDDQPASKQFLTNDILGKQIARWPITNIRILGDDGAAAGDTGFSQVHVAATFGDKVSDVTLPVKKRGGKWRLETSAVKVTPKLGNVEDAAAKTLTVFGTPVGEDPFYVFPGFVDFGSANPYLDVKSEPPLLDKLSNTTLGLFQAVYSVNAEGRKAVTSAVAEVFSACQTSKSLTPPKPCPLSIGGDEGIIDGTVNYGAPDLKELEQRSFDPYTMVVRVNGRIPVPVTAKTEAGGVKQGRLVAYLIGTVDLTQNPPTFTLR